MPSCLVMVVKLEQACGRRLAGGSAESVPGRRAREAERAIRRNSDDVWCGEPPARGSSGEEVGEW